MMLKKVKFAIIIEIITIKNASHEKTLHECIIDMYSYPILCSGSSMAERY